VTPSGLLGSMLLGSALLWVAYFFAATLLTVAFARFPRFFVVIGLGGSVSVERIVMELFTVSKWLLVTTAFIATAVIIHSTLVAPTSLP